MIDPMFLLTLITFAVNALALIVVAYQTWLVRKTLDVTRASIDIMTIDHQLAALPEMHSVLMLRARLHRWNEELAEYSKKLALMTEDDIKAFDEFVSKGKLGPEGLGPSKAIYDHLPDWLREVWIAGAQYYYDPVSAFTDLVEHGKPYKALAQSLACVCDESREGIEALESLVAGMIPEAIGNAPAAIDESRFFSEP